MLSPHQDIRQEASRALLLARMEALRPDSPRQWGTMSADQMLWHLNQYMELPLAIKPAQFALPWPVYLWFRRKLFRSNTDGQAYRNMKTAPEWEAKGRSFDFEAEGRKLKAYVDQWATLSASGCAPVRNPIFGPLTFDEWTLAIYGHIDHHFRQFAI